MAKLVKAKKWDRVLSDDKKSVVKDTAQEKFDAETPKVTLPFVLKDVHVYYLQHAKGGQPKMEPKYKGDNEYPVQILITEKILKQLKKYHKKISYKEYNEAQFKKQFKVDVPDKSLADEEGTYYVIKLASNAAYKKDDEVKQLDPPRVLATDRTSLADTLIGNGSLCNIGFELFTYKHPTFGFGCSVNLKMVNVLNLIEYVGAGDSIDDDDMGFDEEVDDLSVHDDIDDGLDEVAGESTEDLAAKEAAEQAAAQKQNQVDNQAEEPDDIF